jgi:hypothetical protein
LRWREREKRRETDRGREGGESLSLSLDRPHRPEMQADLRAFNLAMPSSYCTTSSPLVKNRLLSHKQDSKQQKQYT